MTLSLLFVDVPTNVTLQYAQESPCCLSAPRYPAFCSRIEEMQCAQPPVPGSPMRFVFFITTQEVEFNVPCFDRRADRGSNEDHPNAEPAELRIHAGLVE